MEVALRQKKIECPCSRLVSVRYSIRKPAGTPGRQTVYLMIFLSRLKVLYAMTAYFHNLYGLLFVDHHTIGGMRSEVLRAP
jgi:hypothetical protein